MDNQHYLPFESHEDLFRKATMSPMFSVSQTRPDVAPRLYSTNFLTTQQRELSKVHATAVGYFPIDTDQSLLQDPTVVLPPRAKRKRGRHSTACACCKFMKKECDLKKNHKPPCTRCRNLFLKHSKIIIENPIQFPSLLKNVYTFKLIQSQECLVDLRNEMVKNQRLGSQDTLLVGDVSQSPIICQMQFSVNEEGIRTLFSHDVHPVVVNPHYRLSTTVEALDAARSSGQDTYPLALDTHQMNNAIALQLLKSFGDDMFSFDSEIIKSALRCIFWLGVLSNWDKNMVYGSEHIRILETKNLVLETTYAFVYQIKNAFETFQSEAEVSLAKSTDPEELICVLQALNRCHQTTGQGMCRKSRKLNCLDKFFQDFYKRSKEVHEALERARDLYAPRACQTGSAKAGLREKLIDEQCKHLPVMSWIYEKINSAMPIGYGVPNLTKQYSYTEILEAHTQEPMSIFLDRSLMPGINNESYENQEFALLAASNDSSVVPGSGPYASTPYYLPGIPEEPSSLVPVNPGLIDFAGFDLCTGRNWWDQDSYQMGPIIIDDQEIQ